MTTEPWWSYPPEVNASRIIGAGPLTWYAAAGAWGMMAAEVAAAQAIFNSQNTLQVMTINGATSASIASKIEPFSAWLAAMHAEATRAALENKAVGDAYVGTVSTTVPLPLVTANRAAAAAAAASSFIVPNPALPILEAQYAGMHVQNASSMTTYDALIQTATQNRVFNPPPRLVDAGAVASAGDPAQIFNTGGAQIQQAIQRAASAIQSPSFVQNLQNQAQAALPPMAENFLSNPAAVSPQIAGQALNAMGPAQGYLGQMAAPINGVRGTGLAGPGMPLGAASAAGSPRGGLPLGATARGDMGGSMPMRAGLGGGTGGPMRAMLGGMGGLAAPPLGGGVNAPGRVGPAYSGLPLGEKGMRGPLGGVPMGAANQGKKEKGGEASFFAENVEYEDRYLAQQKREEKLRQFR